MRVNGGVRWLLFALACTAAARTADHATDIGSDADAGIADGVLFATKDGVYTRVTLGLGAHPADVTLFSESTGSTSVCLLMLSKLSRGLVSRFIMQSNECVQANRPTGKEYAQDLPARLIDEFCPDASGSGIIDCLREQDALALAAFGSEAPGPEGGDGGPGWTAVIDGEGGVLDEDTQSMLARTDFRREQLIIGTDEREHAQLQLIGVDPSHFDTAAALSSSITEWFGPDLAPALVTQYAPQDDADANEAYVRLMTEGFSRCPTRAFARRVAALGGQVYLYSFEYGDAIHGDDVPFVFDGDASVALSYPKSDEAVVAALASNIKSYWTRFAADGDPNGPDTPSWPPFTTRGDQSMRLTAMPGAAPGLSKQDCDLWDSLRLDHPQAAIFRISTAQARGHADADLPHHR